MNDPENPFTMRASEQIDNDSTFLRLFGDSFLELITPETLLSKIHVFFSAPGAGKTTLFRIFTPNALLNIHTNRTHDQFGDLFTRLRDLKVISNEKPELLGIYLRCTNSFIDLDDLEFKSTIKQRLFFSLFATRVIVTALRGILELTKSDIKSLDKIIFKYVPPSLKFASLTELNGKILYDHVTQIDKKILRILDSLDDEYDPDLSTINGLDFLELLKPENVLFEGRSIFKTILIMFDDIHVLKESQIKDLFSKLDSYRTPIPIWLAERKEALDFNELIKGVTGRDFRFIELEDKLKNNFKNLVKKIADLRSLSSRFNITFSECVSGSLDGPEWESRFKEIISGIRKRIESVAGDGQKYDLWISTQENQIQSSRNSAIDWRALEILVQRKEKGGQQLLFDAPLPSDELKKISEYKAVAEFFISKENPEIPYFCEFPKIISLSTNNIEQFLMICGSLFDEVVTNSILKKGYNVTLPRQEKIIKKIARQYWNEIPKGIPYGENASNLLDSFCTVAQERTYRDTASYLPGVTGFGIFHGKFLEITNPRNQQQYQIYKTLEQTLRSCVANNILTVKTDYKQGPKNSDTTIVFYLNRLLCTVFDLPLGYGGFKRTNPSELCRWLKPETRKFGE